MEAILKSGASALLAYTVHYTATKFYNFACVPDGVMGYLTGLLTTGSPICQASVQILSSTQVSYSSFIMIGMTRVIVDLVAPNSPK